MIYIYIYNVCVILYFAQICFVHMSRLFSNPLVGGSNQIHLSRRHFSQAMSWSAQHDGGAFVWNWQQESAASLIRWTIVVLMYGTFSLGLTWHAFGLCRVKICELWNSMNLHVLNSAGQMGKHGCFELFVSAADDMQGKTGNSTFSDITLFVIWLSDIFSFVALVLIVYTVLFFLDGKCSQTRMHDS